MLPEEKDTTEVTGGQPVVGSGGTMSITKKQTRAAVMIESRLSE